MKKSYPRRSVTPDPWNRFRQYTSARIALGRSGGSLPTAEWLKFKLAHARARDAVYHEFELNRLREEIKALGIETLAVESEASSRGTYLQRPDLGRRLNAASREVLKSSTKAFDLAVIISDGLSAMAVHRHTVPLLKSLLRLLHKDNWNLAPILIVPFGRVALQDEIGALLQADIALILLGERPGLGSPDSLGAYLVYQPQAGNTDAQRNCVSNIHHEGLAPSVAADTVYYLLSQARARKLSGIQLKDDRPNPLISKDPAIR